MTPDTNPATVLIVEDERPLADLYAAFLEPAHSVRTAYDGESALESMSDEIDVVLLDRRMPGLTGTEVLAAIRERGYDCRVAMVTAVSPDVDIIEMGFDDYLTKPVERSALRETVDRLLKLADFDELMQEYYRLVTKKVALELEGDTVDLARSDEYSTMVARLDELEAELDSKEEALLSDVDFRSLLERRTTLRDDE